MAEMPPLPQSWADLPFFRQDWPALWQKLNALQDPWQPAPRDLFRALDLTPRAAVRVVILGQDPYHTPHRATGLAFSFPQGEHPKDSLKNILKEAHDDTGATSLSGDLTPWARQGVLLLNTALSVPVGQANGHKSLGWAPLIDQILTAIASDGPRAFVLWGGPAQKRAAALPRAGHLFLESPHPSPLSCYRGFFGSKPFSQINDWLAARGDRPIDWSN